MEIWGLAAFPDAHEVLKVGGSETAAARDDGNPIGFDADPPGQLSNFDMGAKRELREEHAVRGHQVEHFGLPRSIVKNDEIAFGGERNGAFRVRVVVSV